MDLRKTRRLTGPLAFFDLGLGLCAAAMPDVYFELMHHPVPLDAAPLLQRTGVLWLFFAAAEGIAFRWPRELPLAVFLVGMLRLMDVPADVVYGLTSPDLTTFGKAALVAAPLFNSIAGVWLLHAWNVRER